ncbi:MAG: T9SS type A sorting domain-containing protein [Bacteroidales bacterium]|nr:T9SS type A sorting domain-containing protein [Bacteroidales bacterium]
MKKMNISIMMLLMLGALILSKTANCGNNPGKESIRQINGIYEAPPVLDTIMFISNNVDYDSTAIQKLEAQGYVVITTYPSLKNNQTMIDSLNKADLVIIGRSTVSGDIAPAKAEWNGLTVPLLLMSQHSSANNKLNWFNSSNMQHVNKTDTIEALVEVPEDTIFYGVNFASGDSMDWAYSPEDLMILTYPANGTILVSTDYLANAVLVARFEPGVSFYDSICDKPYGPRTYFGAGLNTGGVEHPYTFTSESEKVWLAEVKRLINDPYTPYTPNSDVGIINITLSVGDLSPEFHPDSLTYNVLLPYGATSVQAVATTSCSCATVTGAGTINVSSGTGVANIVVTAEDKTAVSETYTIHFTVNPTVVDVQEVNNFNIHPNPAESYIQLEVSESLIGKRLHIYNILGTMVVERTITTQVERIEMSKLSKGIYFVGFEGNKGNLIQRLIIQ